MSKKGKIKNILGWIFGIIFALIGFSALVSGDIIPALVLFIISIILIPPFLSLLKKSPNLVRKHKNIKLSKKTVISIFVSAMVIIAIILIIKFGETPETDSTESSWGELGDQIAKDTGLDNFRVDSIKDVSQDLEGYKEKNKMIRIKGTLEYSVEIDYYLEDSDGFYVLINQKSCIEGVNRHPKIGQTYTFEGRLLKNNYNYYRLFCDDNVDTGSYH